MPTRLTILQLQSAIEDAPVMTERCAALLELIERTEGNISVQAGYIKQLFQLAGTNNIAEYKAWAQLHLSISQQNNEDFATAKQWVDEAFHFFSEVNDLRGIAFSYMCYGRVESLKEDYISALGFYFKAAALCEPDNGRLLAKTYFYIAHAYSDTFNTDLAVAYFEKALELYEKEGMTEILALCYNNIGANYYDTDKELSLKYHSNALKFAEQAGNKRSMTYSYYWVGTLHIDKENYPLAEEYLQKAKSLCEEISNKHILTYAHISIGRLRMLANDLGSAARHFETAWDIVKEVGNKTWERALYRDWYQLKKVQGNFEEALNLHEQYIKLDKEVSHKELTEKVAAVKFKSDIEKKERDLEIQHLRNIELKQEKELAEQLRRSAEESEKFKEQFLANMSHEIRTPMNAVLGMTNLLLDTTLNEKQTAYLRAVKKSSENLLVILNDILDLSKLAAGKMEFEQVPFRLHEQVTHVMDMLRFKAEEKGLLFTADIAEDVAPVIIGDHARLNQVMINLLSNAIKFTEKGSVALEVTNSADSFIKFSISDTGIGITTEQQKKIFDSFTQAESNISRKYGGTGLGLAICKTFIEHFGGTIGVESQPGKGSNFFFTIPNKVGEESEISKHRKTDYSDYSSLAKLKLLVVEDYEFNQIVIKDTLEHLLPGIAIEIAANGKIAVVKLQANNYDMVLMDEQMPEMDGYEATRYIRNVLKMDIPIVALTASIIRSDLDKCTEAGMNGYLPKPFEREELLGALMKYHVKEPAGI